MLRFFIVAAWAVLAAAEQLPHIEGETLSGKHLALPDDAKGEFVLLIIGFTHGSQSQTKEWSVRARHEFPDEGRLRIFSIAVLQDAPRLIRPMIRSGLKHDLPPDQQDRFLILTRDEKVLKQTAGFSNADDAYLVLLGPDGEIRWRFNGAPGDDAVSKIKSQVQ
ncbi:MAG TPA: hypothetical protein VKU01_08835 [Bryobacteraceae bacterium]|nr:hypothetical protein [Bryobacteraceae bacterium]